MGTAEDAARAGAATVEPLGAARVLVIEDEPGIVDFVRRGLQATGLSVEVAFDGIEGERLALSESFDVIVLDLMLPGRSGLDILAALRAAKSNVPVIVLTARGQIEDRVAGLNAGAIDYLVKPFSMAELAARVRAQLQPAAKHRGPCGEAITRRARPPISAERTTFASATTAGGSEIAEYL